MLHETYARVGAFQADRTARNEQRLLAQLDEVAPLLGFFRPWVPGPKQAIQFLNLIWVQGFILGSWNQAGMICFILFPDQRCNLSWCFKMKMSNLPELNPISFYLQLSRWFLRYVLKQKSYKIFKINT